MAIQEGLALKKLGISNNQFLYFINPISLRIIARTTAKSHAGIQQNTIKRTIHSFLKEFYSEWLPTAEVDISDAIGDEIN